jgi:outer membrane protein OmpA-like peptidoglycan-associated protein
MMEMKYFANCMDYNHETKGCAGYLGKTLATPMEVGRVYEISFQVFIPDEDVGDLGFAENIKIGLYPKKIRSPNGQMLVGGALSLDTIIYNKWYLAKWYVRPICTLEYMVLGVFRGEEWPVVYTHDPAYYYIDDIVIKEYHDAGNIQAQVINVCKPLKEDRNALVEEIEGQNVYFSSNSSEIDEQQQLELDSFAEILKKHPDIPFSITGHTDNVGDGHYELSKERVEWVLAYLADKHRIPKFRSISIYAGSSEPLSDNGTALGRQNNRRVEIRQSDFEISATFYRNLLLEIEQESYDVAYQSLFAWLQVVSQEKKLLMLFDPRINSLKSGPRWREVEKRVKASYHKFANPELAWLLDSLWAEDQKPRTLEYYIENLNVYISDIDEGVEKWEVSFDEEEVAVRLNDEKHFRMVDSLLQKQGWPKLSDVGNRAAKAVFLITTHSNDLNALNRYIPMVKERCLEGEADWIWYVTMYDRLKTLEGLPQRFGTQYKIKEGDEPELFPLEDTLKVNEWRMELGLSPIKIN